MRELGTASDRSSAQVLVDYLLTQKIPAVARDDQGKAVVWVHNEDDVERAKLIWNEFQQNPNDGKYQTSRKAAQELRKRKEHADKKYAALYQDAGDFWGRPSWRRIPCTLALILLSVGTSFYTDFGDDKAATARFTFTDQPQMIRVPPVGTPQHDAVQAYGWRLLKQQTECIRRGEVWRLITPIFLHFDFFHFKWLHLLLNMYALYPLGGLIEARRGALWMLLFVLVTGTISNLGQFYFPSLFELDQQYRDLMGGGIFGGMSGVIFAMFGYLMVKTLLAPEPGLKIPKDTIVFVIIWFLVCISGKIGAIGNTAHGFGLISGSIIGLVPKLWRSIQRKMTT